MTNKALLELCAAATMPVHPVTAERALFWRRDGRPVWSMAGGAPDGDSGDGSGGSGAGGDGKGAGDGGSGDGAGGSGSGSGSGSGAGDGDGDGKDRGYPTETRVEDMKPAEQAAYHRDKANRLQNTLKGFGKLTPDDVKKLQRDYDALVKTGQTDQERAVAEAKETARQEARREAAPQLVESAFLAAAAGRMTAEQVEALVEDIDPMKYVGDDGKVDREKVAAKVAKLAGPVRGKGPDMGQGRRRDVAQSGREAGREAAALRFGSRARSAQSASS